MGQDCSIRRSGHWTLKLESGGGESIMNSKKSDSSQRVEVVSVPMGIVVQVSTTSESTEYARELLDYVQEWVLKMSKGLGLTVEVSRFLLPDGTVALTFENYIEEESPDGRNYRS